MRSVASFIIKGKAEAVLGISGFTVLSWIIPLFQLLASAAIALPTLRKGGYEGAALVAISGIVFATLGGVFLSGAWYIGAYVFAALAPAWLAAIVLRETRRLEVTLGGLALFGMVMVTALYALVEDPASMWTEVIRKLIQPSRSSLPPTVMDEFVDKGLPEVARYITGMVAAGSVLSVSLSLLIARWWQASLFNPGGFRNEFLSLRLNRIPGYVLLALAGVGWLATQGIAEIAWNLLMPLGPLFLLAGFAVLHGILSGTKAGRFWLAGIYVALIVAPYLVTPILLVGFSDAWINWRARLTSG